MASNLIGNLAVNLTMNTAAFQNGATIAEKRAAAMQGKMQGIGNSIKGIGAGLVAGFAAAGVGSLISNAFEIASSMQEAAEATGVTIIQLQRLRTAAIDNGSSADQMDASLTKLSAKLGELQQGSSQAVSAFAAIGLSADQLKGKNPAEAFALIVEKISAIKDPTLQAAFAKDILSKSYGQLLPLIKGGTAALDAAAESSKKNGELSEADAIKLDQLAKKWDDLKTRVGVGIATIIADVANGAEAIDTKFFGPMNKFTKDIDDWAFGTDKTIGDWVLGLESSFNRMHNAAYNKVVSIGPAIMKGFGVAGTAAKNLIGDFLNMNVKGVQYVSNMVTGISNWIGGKLSAVWDSAKAKIRSVVDMFDWMDNEVVRNSYVPDMVIGVNQWFAKMETGMVGSTGRATQSVTEKMAAMQSNVAGILSRLFPEAENIRRIQEEINQLDAAMVSKGNTLSIDVYREAISKLTLELDAAKKAANAFQSAMTPVNDNPTLEDLGIDIQGQINANLPRLSKEPGKTFEDFLGTVQNVAAEVANSMQNMQNSINGFAQSIKKGDIIGIIGGLANIIGAGLDIFSKIQGVSGARANGGPVGGGKTYLVGERGPELFTASRSGYITSNDNMHGGGRAGGGQRIEIVDTTGLFVTRVTDISGDTMQRGFSAVERSRTFKQGRAI